ncbi:MAG: hypothetical protein OXG13_12760 [Gemmatimonadaceae bacterium]|nr:hypothetical protein [Gemmatimonadaceae bacterium]
MRIPRAIALAALVAALPASSVAAAADCSPCSLAAAAPGCHAPAAADSEQLRAACCCAALACAEDPRPAADPAPSWLPSGPGASAIAPAGTPVLAPGATDRPSAELQPPPRAAKVPLYALHGIYLI